MFSQTVLIQGFTYQLFSMSYLWGFFLSAKSFYFVLVLSCALSILATCGPRSVNGEQNRLEFERCGSYSGNSDMNFQDIFDGQSNSSFMSRNLVQKHSLDNVCADFNAFCFPSTLHGYCSKVNEDESQVFDVSEIQSKNGLFMGLHQERSNLSRSCGNFRLLGRKTISCSLFYQKDYSELPCDNINPRSSQRSDISSSRSPFLDRKTQNFQSGENIRNVKSNFVDGLARPQVEIKPSLLDWGEKHLYFPSLAFLTVQNLDSESSLNVYDPFSTNSQFYPCNFSEMVLIPGEVASICFVFLPTQLGLSSAQLVLQTSFGGFVIQTKGFVVNSPYWIKPLVGVDVSSSGRWIKNLSLLNRFDETLYVKEITAWISISSRNALYSVKVVYSINSNGDTSEYSVLSNNDWLVIESKEVDVPLIAMKPHINWELCPLKTETLMELDLSYFSEGKLFGAVCMKLLRSSKDDIDTVVVPLEKNLSTSSDLKESKIPVSVSLDVIVPRDINGIFAVALSLGNNAPYLLSVLKVSEVGEVKGHFKIRYVEGIILFPSTITQIAVLTCAPDTPEVDKNCKLRIWINVTKNSQIEIPCEDVVSICLGQNTDSSIGYIQRSKDVEDTNWRQISLGSIMQPPSEIKAVYTREADELVLRNWKSQATASFMSVLDDEEVLFPTVQVGSHFSRWITVKNPSQEPVVKQLILNAGEIIDECIIHDTLFQPSSSSRLVGNKTIAPTSYGFSIAKNALTEAFVHPYGRASLGPILFQPSNRCDWTSSALIRNNLSGVEWLTLRGFGGLISLALLEESDPVQSLEFKFDLPTPLNFSFPDTLHYMGNRSLSCPQPLTKELYAKNTGDLPLEVRRIVVSGAECSLNGFSVHTCEGFSLQPGEFIKLQISYMTDFSTAIIQRDLELVLATGILVVPKKASLPVYVLDFCRRSMFWTRVKKSMFGILVTASALFLLLFFLFPNVMAFVSQKNLLNSGNFSIFTSNHAVKSSHSHRNHKNSSKFSMSPEMDDSVRSIAEEAFLLESVDRYSDGQSNGPESVNASVGNRKKTNRLLNIQLENLLSSFSLSKSESDECSAMPDASQTGNLMVKIRKERGKSRRKKKSTSTGVSGLFEVSSSQSGNSTPSSPLSPTSLMPKQPCTVSPEVKHSTESRNPFIQVANKKREKSTCSKPCAKANVLGPGVSLNDGNKNWFFSAHENTNFPKKTAGRAVLIPSATFPSAGRSAIPSMCCSPILASTSTISPHARAPGSRFHNRKTTEKHVESTGMEENFTYDIWGDHLFGLPSIDKFNVSAMSPHAVAIEKNSESFFVRSPQILMTNSELPFVNSLQEG